MLRRHLRLGAFILAFLMPAAVPAQTSFVVMGGLSAPVSRLGDLTDMATTSQPVSCGSTHAARRPSIRGRI